MNNISKLLMGVALFGLAACSSDEPANNPGNDGSTLVKGDVAYLNIRISSADDAGSRAADSIAAGASDNNKYLYGDKYDDVDESAVKSAHFYFYDDKGRFVLEANRWTGNGNTGKEENVEYIGENTVVLEGLTGKNYPTWMVTVLNQPEGFEPGATLDAMGEKVLGAHTPNGKTYEAWHSGDTSNPFIMTTSSYFGDDNKDGDNGYRYFATKLNENNFYQETPDKVPFKEDDRVQVYVERLAARVNVDLVGIQNTASKKTYKEGTKEYTLYKIEASVAGETNGDTGNAAATELYVAITGWELTSTAQKSNLMKNLSGWDNNTKFDGTSWAWNHADYHRSYWGKSTTYNRSGDDLKDALYVNNQTWENLKLTAADKVFKGDRAYCNENTNTPGNITTVPTILGNTATLGNVIDPSKTTTVLLRAVVCDAEGNPVELVNYLGLNYLKANFIAKALEIANPQYYTREVAGTYEDENGDTHDYYTYTQIGEDDVKLDSDASKNTTGAVKVVVADNAKEYFTLSGETTKTVTLTYTNDKGEQVTETKTITEKNATPAKVANINSDLYEATDGASNVAIAYTTGASYYQIPIEHLNNPTGSTFVEGQYGVVRNHVYNVRITKINRLGNGVFKPRTVDDEEAETIKTKPNTPTFYVESTINILSWKVVAQTVEL